MNQNNCYRLIRCYLDVVFSIFSLSLKGLVGTSNIIYRSVSFSFSSIKYAVLLVPQIFHSSFKRKCVDMNGFANLGSSGWQVISLTQIRAN